MYRGAGILFYVDTPAGREVLLGRRKINPDFGKWSLFGGRMELFDHDSFTACARREAEEETGHHEIVERALRAFTANESEYQSFKLHLPFVFEWVSYAVALQSKPDLSEWPQSTPSFRHEFSEAGWFPVNRLPDKTHSGIHMMSFLRNF